MRPGAVTHIYCCLQNEGGLLLCQTVFFNVAWTTFYEGNGLMFLNILERFITFSSQIFVEFAILLSVIICEVCFPCHTQFVQYLHNNHVHNFTVFGPSEVHVLPFWHPPWWFICELKIIPSFRTSFRLL